MTTGLTDQNLLSAFRRGDAQAFEMLYARHVRALTAYLLGMMPDQAAVDEIIQQVFIGFLSKTASLPADSNIRSYLFASARNRLANHHRSSARSQNFEKNYEIFARMRSDNHQPSQAALESEETRDRLNNALTRLDEDERDVVLLHTQGDMSFTEIADTLKLPRGTVTSRYRAAIGRLRGFLGHE